MISSFDQFVEDNRSLKEYTDNRGVMTMVRILIIFTNNWFQTFIYSSNVSEGNCNVAETLSSCGLNEMLKKPRVHQVHTRPLLNDSLEEEHNPKNS